MPPRRRPLPLLGTIGLVHAVILAVHGPAAVAAQAPEVGGAEPPLRLKYEAV